MDELVIGLDIGTTNCKAYAFNFNGKPISYAIYEYKSQYLSNYSVINFNEIWNGVCKALRKIGNDVGPQCIGISISSIGEAFIPIDKQGEPVTNEIILPFDNRAENECSKLVSKVGHDKIFYLTGMIPHPMHSISKIMWFKNKYPKLYNKTFKFHCISGFVSKKLGASPLIDHSMASRTMAYNINLKSWDSEMLSAAEIPCDLLPNIVYSGHCAGHLSKRISRILCLPNNLPIFVGGMDQNCAALGCGVIKDGLLMDSVGTTEAILATVSNLDDMSVILDNGLIIYPHVIKNIFVIRGVIPSSGSVLKWCRDNLFQDIKQNTENIDTYDLMFKNMDEKPSKIYVIPYFSGRGSSNLNPNAKGAILGLDLSVNRFEIFKAVVEALVVEFNRNIKIFRNVISTIKEVRAIGGGAKSSKWLQYKADASKCIIRTCEASEAASLGAAIIVCLGLKIYDSADEAVKAMVHVKDTIKPNPVKEERWNQQEDKVRDMFDLLYNNWREYTNFESC